jgi:hypothetical protein
VIGLWSGSLRSRVTRRGVDYFQAGVGVGGEEGCSMGLDSGTSGFRFTDRAIVGYQNLFVSGSGSVRIGFVFLYGDQEKRLR